VYADGLQERAARAADVQGIIKVSKRPRHLLTVAGRVPSCPATAALLSPSATARMTSARNAMRRSVLPAASQATKAARSSSVNATSAALSRQPIIFRGNIVLLSAAWSGELFNLLGVNV
jgi:hypothetical protein